MDLNRLFRPHSIAAIGGGEASEVVRQCAHVGFEGRILPVHPKKAEVEGHACYASVEALPEAPDVAFVGVNRYLTVEVVRALRERGCGGVVCYASGFKESGEEDLQQQLLDAAGDMPLLGPNCYGLINYLDGAALWPDQHGGERVERGVAIFTQSSNIAINLTMQQRGLPIAYVLALGNQAQIGLDGAIQAVIDDERVTAIGLHIEGINDADAFQWAVKAAREKGKPIVAIKTGQSSSGAAMTLSHTASLAGSDQLIDAFFQRIGVARVESLNVFVETLKLLHVSGPLPGTRISSMSCSGGEAALMADAAERHGLSMPKLSEAQSASIADTLSELVTISNPLDYHTFIWGDEQKLTATYTAMVDCGFDLALLVLDFPRSDRCHWQAWWPSVNALLAAKERTGQRVALLASLPENLPAEMVSLLVARGVTPMMGVDDAMLAIRAAARIGVAWQQPFNPCLIHRDQLDGQNVVWDEWRAKTALAATGLSVPQGQCVTAAEVLDTGRRLGFPLVLKACAEHLTHKSELGAVAVGLTDEAALQTALTSMQHLSEQFIVERMQGDVVLEMIVGALRDPQFGPYLVLGVGGVLVELLQDSQILLLPCSDEEIRSAIDKLKGAPLLEGYRGKPAGDIEALVQAVQAIATFVTDKAECLSELDINPLFVCEQGKGVVAVDALLTLLEEEQ